MASMRMDMMTVTAMRTPELMYFKYYTDGSISYGTTYC